jgi:hypothetical protein
VTIRNTTGLVLADNFTSAEILFYSAPKAPAGASLLYLPEWELGQPDPAFLNGDGTPSYGFWYPNVTTGHAPYLDASYAFKQGPDGLGVIETKIIDGFVSQHAAQLWRRSTWNAAVGAYGPDLPFDAWYSWWMYFPQQIDFLNSSGPTFGFTNHIQWYSIGGSNQGPKLVIGAGRNLLHDSQFKWHLSIIDSGIFDAPMLVDRAVPLNTWIQMEARVKMASDSTGRWQVWAGQMGGPSEKLFDYTGPTVSAGSTRIGVSWGNYGGLQSPPNPTVNYRDILISTKAVTSYLEAAPAPRRVTLTADGLSRVVHCSAEPYKLKPNAGLWGTTSYAVTSRRVGQIPGEKVDVVQAQPRTIVVPIQVEGTTELEIDQRLASLITSITPPSETRIVYHRPDGSEREITGLYTAGGDGVPAMEKAGELQRHVTVPLVFKAYWPYWRSVASPTSVSGPTVFNDGRGAGINQVDVVNWGDVDTWPVVTVIGYAEAIEVANMTTGQVWRITEILKVGDTLRIDTDPRSFDMSINGASAYKADALSSWWPLVPGVNRLLFRANTSTGTEPIGAVTLRWHEHFETV